jgi:hypothetical protein
MVLHLFSSLDFATESPFRVISKIVFIDSGTALITPSYFSPVRILISSALTSPFPMNGDMATNVKQSIINF